MTEKFKLKPKQAKALKDLVDLIGKNIPLVEKIEYNTFGVKMEADKVVGLGLNNRGLSTLPESIGNLSSLKELDLRYNKLTTLPESIGNLSSLKELDLNHNKLTTLPESITKLESLQTLNLGWYQLTTLPESIGNLSSLKELDLSYNKLTTLPESITKLESLKELNLKENKLTTLPELIGDLKSLKELNLKENKLTTLPESIGNLKSLTYLDLSLNKLKILPETISNLKLLQTLDLTFNELLTLPESIGNLKSLKELRLFRNKLTTLPESIGNLSSLKELDLWNNQLSTLPESLRKCKNLETISLRGNPWEGKWKGIESHSTAKVLEFCWERAPITVFVSHFRKDKKQYCVRGLKENLIKHEDIREVYSSGVPKIPESQLVLFVATKDSINCDECLHELGLALDGDIGIIPIKGTDITFEDLSQVDLRSEGHGYFNLKDKKGFEFDGDEEKLESFCDELYEYFKQYKRDFNLFDVEARKFDVERENVKNIVKRLIESEKFRAILKESLVQLEKLSEELRSEQISPFEYIFKMDKILNSKSK
ncbi:MAG: leucine-rich repeat domain-containing protein [Promethearchaeota archaeon]